MRKLLCWCIWLLVIESGQLRIENCVAATQSVSGGEFCAQTKSQPEARIVNSQLSILNSPEFSIVNSQLSIHPLPCSDSSPACVQNLSELAVQNSRELVVLEQAIAFQKKKLWTHWLHADGWNPLAIGLRIVRNVAGGGDRAAAKLEIARLELRRSELETELRAAILRAVLAYETTQRQGQDAETKLTTHRNRLALVHIAYRLGEGSTETMLQLWQTETELERAVENAQIERQQRFVQLQSLVAP